MHHEEHSSKSCACGGHAHVNSSKSCACPHHVVVPSFILLIALAFLLKAYGILSQSFVDVAWPILLALIALNKMFESKCKCC